MKLTTPLAALSLVLTAPAAAAPAPAAEAATLRFQDDLGAPVPGLEVCFQVGGARRCRDTPPDAELAWPPRATGLWAAGPGHGPVWIDREAPGDSIAPPADGTVVVPRRARLQLHRAPAGATLDFYRADDPVFRVPLERLRLIDPARPVLAPPGATVLAISDFDRQRPAGAGAADLHRLDLAPGGTGYVSYQPRIGWSAVVRTRSESDGRPISGVAVRLVETSPTAPLVRKSDIDVQVSDERGLALVSGIEAPMASVEIVSEDYAFRTVDGLIAPPGGLLFQEVDLSPGGRVMARILWRGEPAAGLPAALFVQPTDPDRTIEPTEVAFRGRVGPDGRLLVDHVAEGDYLLRVSGPDGTPESRAHADLVVRVDDRRTTEIEADLHPRTIRGRVTRGGAPAPGYRLHARIVRGLTEPGRSGRPRAVLARTLQDVATTGADGRYELTVLAAGDYGVALHTADGTSIAARGVRVNEAHDGEASFALSGPAVSGTVLAQRGGVVEGAEVTLRWGEVNAPDSRIQTTRSDSRGRFEIPFEAELTALRPVLVGARKDGWLGDSTDVAIELLGMPYAVSYDRSRRPTVVTPNHPEHLELTLRRLEPVVGWVVDGEGKPIADARIFACRDEEGSPLTFVGDTRSSATGTFEVSSGVLEGAPRPRWASAVLYASAPGCPLTEVRVAPLEPYGDGANAEIRFPPIEIVCDTPPAALRAHVAFSNHHPAPGEGVALLRNGRMLPPKVVSGHLEELGLSRTTAEDGHLLLVLAPGRWDLYRGDDPPEDGYTDEPGLLGRTDLAPWTVTELYAGSGE